MMLCAKAESNEADLIRLLTDDEYLISERDKRLEELYKPETGESLGNQNAWKFLILVADETWRAKIPSSVILQTYRTNTADSSLATSTLKRSLLVKRCKSCRTFWLQQRTLCDVCAEQLI